MRQHFSHIVYGLNPAREFFKANRRLAKKVWLDDKWKKNPNPRQQELVLEIQKFRLSISFANFSTLDRLSEGGVHQGIVIEAQDYPYVSFSEFLSDSSEKELILALDQITDPQNLGAIARAAWAFGVRCILIPQDRSALITSAALKSSSGALEHLKVAQVVNLSRALGELQEKGFWIYGAALAEEAIFLKNFSPALKSVLVLGSEGKGLRPLVMKSCDQLVCIPMANDFDSINVSQAAAILLQDCAQKMQLI